MSFFERLSAQDAAFLEFEDENNPMHVAAMLTFDPTPVVGSGEAIPIDSIRKLISARLGLLPKYRQRIIRAPISGHPVWVDDLHFDLRQHLRHIALPRPGRWESFVAIFEEFISQKLDRDRPLWELWVVEGLEDGNVGLMGKVHHCLIDGVSGVDMMMLLLGFEPSMEIPEPGPWTARPAPTPMELLRAEGRRIIDMGRSAVDSLRSAVGDPKATLEELEERSAALTSAGDVLSRSGGDGALNGQLSPLRQFRGSTIPLADVKQIRQQLGGTVNDVVLGLLSGALRTFLEGRGELVDRLDLRATIPMSTRLESERGTLGNKLAVVAANLPVNEPNARRRMDAARVSMEKLKDSKQALITDMLTRVAEWTSATVLTQGIKMALQLRVTHLMITNIRGPAEPLYCMAAPMVDVFPAPELWTDQALGVGVLSYRTDLRFGFVGNRESLPDLDDFVAAFEAEVDAVREMVGLTAPEPSETSQPTSNEHRSESAQPASNAGNEPPAQPAPTGAHETGEQSGIDGQTAVPSSASAVQDSVAVQREGEAPARVREIPVGEGPAWEAALACWDQRGDDRQANEAARQFEALAESARNDADAYAWAARANYFLGDYAEGNAAAKLFERGTMLGRKGIELSGDHIPSLFWTSCCLGASAEHMNLLRRASVGPELIRTMGKVWEKDPAYFNHGAARFLGQAMVRQGGLVTKVLRTAMPEIGPERVLRELRTSVENDPPYVLTFQTLAELAWQENRDRETVTRMKAALDEFELDSAPELAPDNHRDLPRARRVLAQIG